MNQKTDELYKVVYIISILVVLLVIILIIQFHRRKIYKKKFEGVANTTINTTNNEMSIPQDIVGVILKGLHVFERDKKFISREITLNTLAKELKTNTTYLSKIINHYKNTSFSNYLHTLRIEYAIEQLKVNSTFRKFTIKAIAEEVGFNNSESFSKAFYKVKGMKPSYFLSELEKIV